MSRQLIFFCSVPALTHLHTYKNTQHIHPVTCLPLTIIIMLSDYKLCLKSASNSGISVQPQPTLRFSDYSFLLLSAFFYSNNNSVAIMSQVSQKKMSYHDGHKKTRRSQGSRKCNKSRGPRFISVH